MLFKKRLSNSTTALIEKARDNAISAQYAAEHAKRKAEGAEELCATAKELIALAEEYMKAAEALACKEETAIKDMEAD